MPTSPGNGAEITPAAASTATAHGAYLVLCLSAHGDGSMWHTSRRYIRRLYGGEKLCRVTALLARPVARALTPAEWNVIIDAGGWQVHHYHSGLRVTLEVRCVLERGRCD